MQEDKDESWEKARQYYNIDFSDRVGRLKKPLIDSTKRKKLSILLKNDHLTVRSVHNTMLERIVYT